MFFFSSRRRHTRSLCDWSSDVCSSDLEAITDPRVLVLCFVYFTHVIAGYGLDFFLPTLVKKSFPGSTPFIIGVISGIPAFFALLVMSPYGRSSDRRGERKWHYALAVWWGALGLSG